MRGAAEDEEGAFRSLIMRFNKAFFLVRSALRLRRCRTYHLARIIPSSVRLLESSVTTYADRRMVKIIDFGYCPAKLNLVEVSCLLFS